MFGESASVSIFRKTLLGYYAEGVYELYVSLGSRVSPSIFGFMFIGSVMLSICISSCVLYSAGSGVKRVHFVLSGLRMRLFV